MHPTSSSTIRKQLHAAELEIIDTLFMYLCDGSTQLSDFQLFPLPSAPASFQQAWRGCVDRSSHKNWNFDLVLSSSLFSSSF